MAITEWELVDDKVATQIEFSNYLNQFRNIESMFRMYSSRYGIGNSGCSKPLNTKMLREFHRAATLFLLKSPGVYRTVNVDITERDGTIVYNCPKWPEVGALMVDFGRELKRQWLKSSPLELAAYALWRITWIHPFKNGNGRAARAFAYACLCLRHGMFLPGNPTVLDLMMNAKNQPKYQGHLRWADQTFHRHQKPDLEPLISLLDSLLTQQMTTIPEAHIPLVGSQFVSER